LRRSESYCSWCRSQVTGRDSNWFKLSFVFFYFILKWNLLTVNFPSIILVIVYVTSLLGEASKLFPPDFASLDPQAVYAQFKAMFAKK
jgi:hypothetical protein